ncbi:MAG: nickel pincer cofactor biosynthesis protein LarB [Planctomycetes bacterium]|nr:nickel pincer cofactor biosynthesis protein LarB [Planctomycetota bacterium]
MHDAIRRVLEELAAGRTDVASALESLASLPGEDLGFANLDHHRVLRNGMPEVVYGEGKRPDEIALIVDRLRARGHPVLVTRLSQDRYDACRERLEAHAVAGDYDALSRTWRWNDGPFPVTGDGTIVVACAGTSDLPVAEEAARTAEVLGNRVERVVDVGVAGLHRTLAKLDVLRRARAVIVVAGMEGALPSVVGGLVACPVIAVPTSVGYGASYGGLAALLAMLNSCASGVTVVNIDNGFGAACAASRITHAAARARDAADAQRDEGATA